jgi:hypothetical protein
MTNPDPDWREREVDSSQYKTVAQVAFVVIVLLVGVLIGASLFAGDDPVIEDTGYWTNLFTEVISVIVTVGLIGLIFEHRRKQQLKRDLVQQTKRRSNDTVLDAIDALRENGWLTGEKGVLQGERWHEAQMQGANLQEANLQDADLVKANLQGAKLGEANLHGANLIRANLQGADLVKANLQDADSVEANLKGTILVEATLQGADLWQADLQGTVLWWANLQGVDLRGANLKDTDLADAQFDENTILPDALPTFDTNAWSSKWTPDTDMARFTDPDHPDFWQPGWVKDQQP